MAKLKTTPFDVADHLRTPQDRARFLELTIEETDGDPKAILSALNTIARSEGMTKVARQTGLSRESLYKALSETGNPEFSTIYKVIDALGLSIRVSPMKTTKPKATLSRVSRSTQATVAKPKVTPSAPRTSQTKPRVKQAA